MIAELNQLGPTRSFPPPGGELSTLAELGREFPWTIETELERLKNRLLREALTSVVTAAVVPALRRAANEAAALAWLEPYPLLVFPGLFQEKAQAAQRRVHKQGLVRARSELLLAVAA